MDRRSFMNRAAVAAAATFTADMTLSQRADAFEGVMINGLPREVAMPVLCEPDMERTMVPPTTPVPGGAPPAKMPTERLCRTIRATARGGMHRSHLPTSNMHPEP